MKTIELSADGTEHAEVAFDAVMEAVAEAETRGLTWADVDGQHQAAIVAPEFGLFVELLMRRDTRIRAEIIHPDGSRQSLHSECADVATDIVVHQTRELRNVAEDLGILDPPSSRDPDGQG